MDGKKIRTFFFCHIHNIFFFSLFKCHSILRGGSGGDGRRHRRLHSCYVRFFPLLFPYERKQKVEYPKYDFICFYVYTIRCLSLSINKVIKWRGNDVAEKSTQISKVEKIRTVRIFLRFSMTRSDGKLLQHQHICREKTHTHKKCPSK